MPYEIEEDHTLRNMVGGSAGIAKVFSTENVQRAQKVIDDARSDFFSGSALTLGMLREAIFAGHTSSTTVGEAHLKQVQDFVSSLGRKAEALNFPLISSICNHMQDVCRSAHGNSGINYAQLIRDMLDLLKLSLQQKITDASSQAAQDVMASLQAVSARIHQKK